MAEYDRLSGKNRDDVFFKVLDQRDNKVRRWQSHAWTNLVTRQGVIKPSECRRFNANVYCSPIYFVFEGISTRQDRTHEIRNLQTVESMAEGSFVSERRNGDTWNVKHLALRKL
ncbi:unnamed protein product [Fusarium graminearum]|uniref:Uncharacterized protein n=1 Tax=Gibberella zeae TaxID=5518 RepID=A0A4E9EEB2_GIBZA